MILAVEMTAIEMDGVSLMILRHFLCSLCSACSKANYMRVLPGLL